MGEAHHTSAMHIDPVVPKTVAEWKELWEKATNPTRRIYPHILVPKVQFLMQFRARIRSPTPNTYLCLEIGGLVHINGKKEDEKTLFRVINFYQTGTGHYQLICNGGPYKNYILYVIDGKLQARKYHSEKDNPDNTKELPNETLFILDQNAQESATTITSLMGGSLMYPGLVGDQDFKVQLKTVPPEDRLVFGVSFYKETHSHIVNGNSKFNKFTGSCCLS